MPKCFLAACLVLAVGWSAADASAAIVQSTAAAPARVDLTAEGTADWAQYSYSSGLITVSKAAGTDLGALQLIGSRSDGSYTASTAFDWTDGDSPATGAGVTSGASDNTWGGDLLRLTVHADTQQRDLALYLMRANGVITVTATLSDDPGNPSTYSYPGTGYAMLQSRHLISFAASSADQTLTVVVSGGDAPQYVTPAAGLSAATVQVIPEPASLALAALGAALLGARRRVAR